MARFRIVVTAPDLTGSTYSGMGLRALGLAEALSQVADVTVLAGGAVEPGERPFEVVAWDGIRSAQLLRDADVVITANGLRLRELSRVGGRLVFDLYDPSIFEYLSQDDPTRRVRLPWMANQLRVWRLAIALADAVLCANTRQRDLLLGAALAIRRDTSIHTLDEGALASFSLMVPNGVTVVDLPDRTDSRTALGIESDQALVLLWGGGIWDWMDPTTVIRAVALCRSRGVDVRLVFLGLRRSGTDPHARAADRVVAEAEALGIWGDGVLANDQWVPADKRWMYVAAADIGILMAHGGLETHFSFRTRFVDCLAGGLPVVASVGDSLGERGEREGWATLVPVGDVSELAQTLTRLAADRQLLTRMGRAAETASDAMSWEQVVAPLVELVTGWQQTPRTPPRRRAVLLRAALDIIRLRIRLRLHRSGA